MMMQTLCTGEAKKDKKNLEDMAETIYNSLPESQEKPTKKEIQ